MRIKPIEDPKAKTKETIGNVKAILFAAVVVTVMFLSLMATLSLYDEYCGKKYKTQIESLKVEILKLNREVEELENELAQKDEEILNLKRSTVTMTKTIEPVIKYADIPKVQDCEFVNLWNFQKTEVTNVTNASAEQLNALVRQILEHRNGFYDEQHPLANIGDTLVQIESENGISATFILSILTWESGFCAYEGWPDEYKYSNNCAGIMNDSDPRYFKNINECILYLGQLLRDVYIDEHKLISISDIGMMYCESPQWGEKIEVTMMNYNSQLSDIINLEETQ